MACSFLKVWCTVATHTTLEELLNYLHTLHRHNAIGLSADTPFDFLANHHQPQIFQQPEQNAIDTLNAVYSTDAALVQYVLTGPKGDPLGAIFRFKEASLFEVKPSEIKVSMRWVILDWDLDSKGIAWGSENKPETQESIRTFIECHPRLKHAYAYYFSKSGVRIIFSLKNPFTIETSEDVQLWKIFYRTFIKLFDVSSIGGEIEAKADPFTLNRVPNYKSSDGVEHRSAVYQTSYSGAITVKYPPKDVIKPKVQASEKREYPQLDTNAACAALWEEPLIKNLRETNRALSYNDWRGLGTNIAALLGEAAGLSVFLEISSWDTSNYDAEAVNRHWPNMVKSADEYGPMTWSNFEMDLSEVYQHVKDTSSLAAQVRRAVRNADSPIGSENPTADNSQEVMQLLYMKVATKEGQESTPLKTPPNLRIILENDNRWANRIRRNHLGAVDMLGNAPLCDEDVTLIRETISRVYGLTYSKDDIWDFIKLIANANEYHPVKDYLDTLEWDGKDRIKGLAASLGQTDDFAETLLRKFLISCVVRPLKWDDHSQGVNWKIDTVLILKGTQGKRKSSFFKALCSDEEWFSDNLPSITLERKDASLHMLGKWIVEQAEFEGHVARSSVENMKAFITREREIFRKAYARAETNMRRPSVLVGTTNSSSFLNDPTGDRRFWVLEIPDTVNIDLAWVRQNRDQLWAQAVEMFRNGLTWWLTDAESTKSNEQNSKFRRPDPLDEAIQEFINSEPTMAGISESAKYEDSIGFTLKQLVSIGLDKKLADLKANETQRITSYLVRMGFEKVRLRVNGKRVYMFRKLKGFDDEEVY